MDEELIVCESCGNELESWEEVNDDGFCETCSEPCGTCNYNPCACDTIYDSYKDSLLDRLVD